MPPGDSDTLLDTLPCGFVQLDAADRVVRWNHRLALWTTIPRASAIGHTLPSLFPSATTLPSLLSEARRSLDHPFIPDSPLLPIPQPHHATLAPLPEGHLAITLLDATDRHHAASLETSHQRLELALDAAATCTWDNDVSGNHVSLDSRWATMLGLPPAPLLTTARALLANTHPDDRALALDATRTAIAGHSDTYQVEHRVRHSAGHWIWILSRGRVIARDPQGRASRMIGTNTDITPRKTAELARDQLLDQLNRHAAALEAANRELEAFSYSASHDLRSPLRGIDGWSLALVEDYADRLDDRARDYLARIRADAQRMGLLIDDLINLARVHRVQLVRDPVDLSALATRLLASLRAHSADRSVECHVAQNLSASGDPSLLELLLQNLLGNAWKFSARRPAARIEFGRADTPGGPAFFVRDNGAGFDMAHAAKLFHPFTRLHKTSDFPGTGIGLAIVHRIAHRHGGQVWAEAAPDRGATFYFTLP